MADRLVLRALRLEDVDELVTWFDDETFRTRAGWSARAPRDRRRFWLAQVSDPAPELLRLAATEDGHLVGYADLHGTTPGERELGYLVGPSRRWGRGLGGRIATAGLGFGFGRLGLDLITAEVATANEASVRILRSAGMRPVGPGLELEHLGRPGPSLRWQLTRAQWSDRTSTTETGSAPDRQTGPDTGPEDDRPRRSR